MAPNNFFSSLFAGPIPHLTHLASRGSPNVSAPTRRARSILNVEPLDVSPPRKASINREERPSVFTVEVARVRLVELALEG